MARPQAFDQQQVLEDAMQLFWRQGYASTSVRDLTQATRLQPGSLYGAFGNKRQLFLQSLEHYFSSLHDSVKQLLHDQGPPLQRIENFFQALIRQSRQDHALKGCLLVNTLLETPAEDADINQRVSGMLQQVQQDFAELLQQAQSAGELPADKDPARLARLLMTGIFGLRVYNRMRPTAAELSGIVEDILSILR